MQKSFSNNLTGIGFICVLIYFAFLVCKCTWNNIIDKKPFTPPELYGKWEFSHYNSSDESIYDPVMVNYTKRSVNSISISENMINEGSNFANVVESSLGSRDYDLYTYINKDEFSGGKQSCYYRIKVSPQKKSIEVWYNVSGRYGHPAEGISDSNYFENIDYLGVYTKK